MLGKNSRGTVEGQKKKPDLEGEKMNGGECPAESNMLVWGTTRGTAKKAWLA